MEELLNLDLMGLKEELKIKIREAAETIEAIKNNQIDAFVVNTENGEKVFTLRGTENIFREMLDKINEAAVIFAENGTIFYSNKKFNQILGLENREDIIGSTIYKFISPLSIKKIEIQMHDLDERLFTGIEMVGEDGISFPVNMSIKSIDVSAGIPLKMMMINTINTIQPDNPSAFNSADEIINLTSDAIIVTDNNGKILRFNRTAIVLADQSFINTDIDSVFQLFDNAGIKVSLLELVNKNVAAPYEFKFYRKDDKTFYLNIGVEPLKGNTGTIYGHVFTITNITKHILAEEKAIKLLNEKTVLLKEIHHRIKNNFQIISSIIKLQSYYVKDPDALELFNELKGMLRSVSLIHEMLYQTESLVEVKMSLYIRSLVNYIITTYEDYAERIIIEYDVEPLFIVPEKVLSLGLIITELVTNTIKYAFPERKGIINITLKPKGKKIQFILKDNGIGIPGNINIENSDTLGLQLVNTLVEQLGGTLNIRNKEGAEFDLIF